MRDHLYAEITAQAALRPDAPAIVNAGEQLTYGELEETSNRLARLLRAAGCRRGDRVAMLMPRGAAAVISILGVLKADAIWVPIDPTSSAAGVRRILASCDSKWILADDTQTTILEELFDNAEFAAKCSIGWMSRAKVDGRAFSPAFTWTDLDAYSSVPMHCASRTDDATHILFTSASTGTPKGVVFTHRNVLAFIHWARRYFGTSPDDRLSWHSPLHVNLATIDIFGALGVGATLYPVPGDLGLLPHRLAEFIRDAELTQWFSVPSVLSYMASFDAVRYGDFPSVRRVLWCGDVLPTPTLIHWMQRMPHSTFTNLYAPAATAMPSSYFTVPACPESKDEDIPIGRACPGTELLVLNELLNPLPVGEVGDLYLRGVGVSPVYWQDEEQARDTFPPNVLDGSSSVRVYRTGDLARLGSDGFIYHAKRANGRAKPGEYRVAIADNEVAKT
jgi:amino acid adenylation domain-containing protein